MQMRSKITVSHGDEWGELLNKELSWWLLENNRRAWTEYVAGLYTVDRREAGQHSKARRRTLRVDRKVASIGSANIRPIDQRIFGCKCLLREATNVFLGSPAIFHGPTMCGCNLFHGGFKLRTLFVSILRIAVRASLSTQRTSKTCPEPH